MYMYVHDPEPEPEPQVEPEPSSDKMSEPEPSSNFPVPQHCLKHVAEVFYEKVHNVYRTLPVVEWGKF
jgi:hypothetical protein